MELSEKYILELNNFHKAVNSFKAAMDATFENLNSIGEDLIKNGKIQKFEYCAELAWKISKIHVELFHGVISNSPKSVYKTMFQLAIISESEYLALIKTIEDRNLLSHIYKESMYQEVFERLPLHLLAIQWLIAKL
jgi:nucleotidyltransferase substrate binding protein (TIGR01987 family)